MASPTVNGTPSSANVQTAGTSFGLTMPTGIVAGELLLACVAHKIGDGTPAMSGWTRFLDVPFVTGSGAAFSAFWKAAAGGDTGTFTVTSSRIAYVVYRIGGAAVPGTRAPEATSASFSNSSTPDPPAITPTGGSKDYLFIVGCCSSGGRTVSAYPTNYSGGITSGPNNGTATNIGIGTAQRALTTATEDPAAFTTTATGTEEASAVTIAIHPGGAAAATSSPPVRPAQRHIHMLTR